MNVKSQSRHKKQHSCIQLPQVGHNIPFFLLLGTRCMTIDATTLNTSSTSFLLILFVHPGKTYTHNCLKASVIAGNSVERRNFRK